MIRNTTFEKLLSQGKSFALYYRPNGNDIELIVGDAAPVDNYTNRRGFIMAPYLSSDTCPSLLIKPDIYVKGKDEFNALLAQLEYKESLSLSSENSECSSQDRNSFEQIVSKAIQAIHHNSSLEKVVLSRSIDYHFDHDFDPILFLDALHKAMPKAFAYLTYTPQSGVWLGATPERLFESDGKIGQTNSIAGTMPFNSDRDWTIKEKNEQQIVSDYILDHLKQNNVKNIEVVGPSVVKSGSVQHLKTEFSFPLHDEDAVGSLINALHPTPAICGMPKDDAQYFITKNEGYNREYYAGYLGPLGLDGTHSIFVNLRCMKVVHDKATLYVGAGISDGSEASAEWEETQTKALTLLNLLQSK